MNRHGRWRSAAVMRGHIHEGSNPSFYYAQVWFSTSHRGGLISSVRRLPGWMHLVGLFAGCGVLATCSAGAIQQPGRTFHVSPRGDDTAAGLSPATAWRSLARASTEVLRPGDRLLLEGGARFAGTLELGPQDAGNATDPVVIAAYGSGGPVIDAGDAPAMVIADTAGIEINDVTAVGSAQAYQRWAGILLTNEQPDGDLLEHVHLNRVDVSGFKRGIEVAASGTVGFRDVLIANASLHDNLEAGFASHGPEFSVDSPAYAHENVVLRRVASYRNVGDRANTTRNTGSGGFLGSVRRALVEQCRFFDNGASSAATEGPLGLWAYDSTGVVIQQNASYRNRTAATDGGGFGLDINVSDSVLQYNLSYDNDGPGYQLYTWQANDAHTRNTVRFNISRDDARRTVYGAVTVLGRVSSSDVYQNTVLLTASTARERPPVVLVGAEASEVSLRNNIFVTDGAGVLVSAPALRPPAVFLQGNDYHAGGGPWVVQWGDQAYVGLDAWRAATGQELLGAEPTGLAQDPSFADPDAALDTAPAGSDLPAAAPGLRLVPASPLIGAGLDLPGRFGIEPGPLDFFGTPLAGATTTAGAHRPAGA